MAEKDWQQLQTLFNLDYYLTELLANTNSNDENYSRWRMHRATLDLESLFDGAFAPKPFSKMEADLARLKGRYLQHAHGVRAMAMVSARLSNSSEPLRAWDELGAMLPLLFDKPALSGNTIASVETAMKGYTTAALQGGCNVEVLNNSFFFDNFLVTRVAIELVVQRPITDFVRSYDPRRWDVAAPEAFEIADELDEADRTKLIPGASLTPPPVDDTLEAGRTKSFSLFEQAVTAVGGRTDKPALADFRNILAIDYRVGSAAVKLDYSLSEPLTLIVNGSTVSGGLDVDSGGAVLDNAPSGGTRISVSKSVRIAQPPIVRDILNSHMASMLRFWFFNLVVLGACSDREV